MQGTWFPSQKGGQLLEDTYMFKYTKNREKVGTPPVYYRCVLWKSGKCKATAVLNKDTDLIVEHSNDHNHSSNIHKHNALMVEKEYIKAAGLVGKTAPRRVLGEITSAVLSSNCPESVFSLRKKATINKAIQRQRLLNKVYKININMKKHNKILVNCVNTYY